MIMNHEGYSDPTARAALNRVALEDRKRRSEEIQCLIREFRRLAAEQNLEIANRIAFRDKATGELFR